MADEHEGMGTSIGGWAKAAGIVVTTMILGVALAAMPAAAQEKPDYSGTWKLDLAKSDFGQYPGPSSETIAIAQKGSDVKEDVDFADDQGSHKYTVAFTVDGPEVTFSGDSAPQIGIVTLQKVKAAWQGSTMVVTEALKYEADADVTGTNTYVLSADGKMLTMSMDFTTPGGEMVRKAVFDKDEGGGTGNANPAHAMSGSSTAAEGGAAKAGAASEMAAPGAAAASAPAGPVPNFSGTWKLNLPESDFGQIPPPDSRTENIEDSEPNIKIVSTWTGGPMGDGSMTENLMTNGKETTSEIFGSEAKSIARWDGDSLVVNTTMQMQDGDAAFRSVYKLSPDGKILTVTSHVSGPMGEMDLKAVYDKQ